MNGHPDTRHGENTGPGGAVEGIERGRAGSPDWTVIGGFAQKPAEKAPINTALYTQNQSDSPIRYTIAYMHVSEIDTPALVVDLDIMERNLARVADYAREHGLRL